MCWTGPPPCLPRWTCTRPSSATACSSTSPLEDRQFAILGDGGINAAVPEGFWDDVKDTVIAGLSQAGKAGEGLAAGIRLAGEQLSAHFPVADDDVNELSDDISFGS